MFSDTVKTKRVFLDMRCSFRRLLLMMNIGIN